MHLNKNVQRWRIVHCAHCRKIDKASRMEKIQGRKERQERLFKCVTHVSFAITCEGQLSQFLQCFFLSLKTCGILQCYELLIGRIASSGINPNGADSLKGRLSFKLRNLITTWIKSHQSNSFTNYDRQGLQIFAKRGGMFDRGTRCE